MSYSIPDNIFKSATRIKTAEGVPGFRIFMTIEVYEKIKRQKQEKSEKKDSVSDQVEFEGKVNFTEDRSSGNKTFITFQLSKWNGGKNYINQKCYTFHKSHIPHIEDGARLKVLGTLETKTLEDGRTFENLKIDKILEVDGVELKEQPSVKPPASSLREKHKKIHEKDLLTTPDQEGSMF